MLFIHITHKVTVDVAERHTASAPRQIFNFTATCWQPTPFLPRPSVTQPLPALPTLAFLFIHCNPTVLVPLWTMDRSTDMYILLLFTRHFHTCDRGHPPSSYMEGTLMLSDFCLSSRDLVKTKQLAKATCLKPVRDLK